MRSQSQPSGSSRRTFVAETRRAQLVDCAIAAIKDVGLQRASLAEIGRRAGLSKAGIFTHFSGRDELIREVVATVVGRGAEFMSSRVAGAATPAKELSTYIEANVEYIAAHRDDVVVLTAIAVGFTDDEGGSALPHDASVYEVSLAPVRDILSRGQATGDFGEFDTWTMAMTIRAAIDAIGPQLATMDLDLDGYAADLVELFDAATRPRPR